MNPQVSNPNDIRVVEFHNSTDFGFTPEMGCMFDGKPIFGISGAPGVNAGEKMMLPYHVAHRLATNLAKVSMTRQAPAVDPAGIPTGVPLWDSAKLEEIKNSYLTDLFTESKPVAKTEVEQLMAKVEEYRKMTEELLASKKKGPEVAVAITPSGDIATVTEDGKVEITPSTTTESPTLVFQDKQEVIAELEKRGIKHDKRKGMDELKKLLLPVPTA